MTWHAICEWLTSAGNTLHIRIMTFQCMDSWIVLAFSRHFCASSKEENPSIYLNIHFYVFIPIRNEHSPPLFKYKQPFVTKVLSMHINLVCCECFSCTIFFCYMNVEKTDTLNYSQCCKDRVKPNYPEEEATKEMNGTSVLLS